MPPIDRVSQWFETYQVPLYFLAILAGLGAAIAWGSEPFQQAANGKLIEAFLLPLMFATFLSVPLTRVARGIQDIQFGGLLLTLNFLLVPLVIWLLSRPFTDSPMLVGLVLVLVCPCVDYVIVFTRISGGDADRLVAWTPILLFAQMLLLPVFLWLIAGHSMATDAGPFWHAFRYFIVVPLLGAAVVQRLGSMPSTATVARGIENVAEILMVPLMMGTLSAVVATQWDTVQSFGGQLGQLVPVYLVFAGVVALVALGVGLKMKNVARLSHAKVVALTFSPVTRNSLVIMPFALVIAKQPGLEITPAVVLTQTLVELLVMVVMVLINTRRVSRPGLVT